MPQIWGRAFIGGAKYQGVVRKSRAPFKAILINEDFGIEGAFKLFDALGADGHTTHIMAYGVWDDNHRFDSNSLKLAVARAKRFQQIANKYPHKQWFYAPYLEHKCGAGTMIKVMEQCRRVAPTVHLVNNPIRGGAYMDGFIDEIHHDDHNGKPSGVYFFSFDGRAGSPTNSRYKNGSVDAPHETYRQRYDDAMVFMEWILQDNGKANTKDTKKRPQRRAYTTTTLDESVCYLMKRRAEKVYVTKGDIYGSHSEQFADIGTGKENKPFYITARKRYKKLQLITWNGNVLATITKSERYKHGNGYLYRFSDWGYKYAQRAIALQGDPMCRIMADGKEIAVIDPGFREPGK